MTIEEKWQRMKSPKTLEDRGLSITFKELATFPEGREVIKDLCDEAAARDILRFGDIIKT